MVERRRRRQRRPILNVLALSPLNLLAYLADPSRPQNLIRQETCLYLETISAFGSFFRLLLCGDIQIQLCTIRRREEGTFSSVNS